MKFIRRLNEHLANRVRRLRSITDLGYDLTLQHVRERYPRMPVCGRSRARSVMDLDSRNGPSLYVHIWQIVFKYHAAAGGGRVLRGRNCRLKNDCAESFQKSSPVHDSE